MKLNDIIRCQELTDLCARVKELAECEKYDACCDLICHAMASYPAAPQPHNLLGVILEKTGDHPAAMRHFRAAWALDPTYAPAGQNLNTYGTFFSSGAPLYDDETELPAVRSVSFRGSIITRRMQK